MITWLTWCKTDIILDALKQKQAYGMDICQLICIKNHTAYKDFLKLNRSATMSTIKQKELGHIFQKLTLRLNTTTET